MINSEIDNNANIEQESNYIASFEEAYKKLMETQSEKEIDEVIKDLTKILEVSEKNFEFVKNEKWFQRAWYTITRKNSKLEKQNQSNLLIIQKGSMHFLNRISLENVNLRLTVKYCLDRIEKNQIQDEKIKMFIIEWTSRNNKKMKSFENRLEVCEDILKKGGMWSKLKRIFKGESNKIEEKIILYKKTNEQVKREVLENYLAVLQQEANLEIYKILETITNIDNNYGTIMKKLDVDNIPSKEFTKIIKETIDASDLQPNTVDRIIIDTINSSVDILDSINMSIVNTYIPDSPFKLQIDISYQEKARLVDLCIKRCDKFKKEVSTFNAVREQLISQFPRYKKAIEKNEYLDIGAHVAACGVAGFAAGILGGPILIGAAVVASYFGDDIKENIAEFFGVETDKKVINNFADKYGEYFNIWDGIYNNAFPDLYEVVANEFAGFIKARRYEFIQILDEFTEEDVDLRILNDELICILKDFESQNDSSGEEGRQ